MSDPFYTATIVFALQYIGAGMMFVTSMKSPRKRVFVYRAMTFLNAAQLISSICMVIFHTIGQSPISAMVWGVMLCLALYSTKKLRERRILYQDYLETNEKLLELKDAVDRLIRQVGERKKL